MWGVYVPEGFGKVNSETRSISKLFYSFCLGLNVFSFCFLVSPIRSRRSGKKYSTVCLFYYKYTRWPHFSIPTNVTFRWPGSRRRWGPDRIGGSHDCPRYPVTETCGQPVVCTLVSSDDLFLRDPVLYTGVSVLLFSFYVTVGRRTGSLYRCTVISATGVFQGSRTAVVTQ